MIESGARSFKQRLLSRGERLAKGREQDAVERADRQFDEGPAFRRSIAVGDDDPRLQIGLARQDGANLLSHQNLQLGVADGARSSRNGEARGDQRKLVRPGMIRTSSAHHRLGGRHGRAGTRPLPGEARIRKS